MDRTPAVPQEDDFQEDFYLQYRDLPLMKKFSADTEIFNDDLIEILSPPYHQFIFQFTFNEREKKLRMKIFLYKISDDNIKTTIEEFFNDYARKSRLKEFIIYQLKKKRRYSKFEKYSITCKYSYLHEYEFWKKNS